MKTKNIILSVFLVVLCNKITSKEFNYPIQIKQSFESSICESFAKSPNDEYRVTGYYEEGYGSNATWKKISLKVEIVTNSYGKDEIKVVAYKNENSSYWTTVSYSNVTKTYGKIADDFSYQVYVASKTVYFNI